MVQAQLMGLVATLQHWYSPESLLIALVANYDWVPRTCWWDTMPLLDGVSYVCMQIPPVLTLVRE